MSVLLTACVIEWEVKFPGVPKALDRSLIKMK